MTHAVEILPFIREETGTSPSRYTDYLTELFVVFLGLPVIILPPPLSINL